MWAYIFKDRGSKLLPEITDDDYEFIIKEYNQFYEQVTEYQKLTKRIDDFLKHHLNNFAWFDKEVMKTVNKENLYRFSWILIRLFERRLEKKGLLNDYTFLRELKITRKNENDFMNYFLEPDKIGTYNAFILSPNKNLADDFTISGYPFFRLLWAPIGYIFRSNIFFRFLWSVIYNWFSFFDLILLGLPYYLVLKKTKLPKKYFDTERLLGKYVFGNSTKIKQNLRKIVLSDEVNYMAYFASFWAVFVREKLVETMIKNKT